MQYINIFQLRYIQFCTLRLFPRLFTADSDPVEVQILGSTGSLKRQSHRQDKILWDGREKFVA
jgi:hypothetical protein